MKHFVITVGCEFGSGGPEIGKMLAKSLGIEYYDRDLVDKVVEKIGVEKHLVEEADNKNFVPYGIETSLGTRYANCPTKSFTRSSTSSARWQRHRASSSAGAATTS